MKLRYRTIFISDTHLGSRSARAQDLAEFLRCVKCEKLYLVGDIIDMWRLKNKWYWPHAHNLVVHRILKMTRKKTEVIFLPGNHDEAARQFAGMEFGGITIRKSDVHTTADDRRLWVVHGDAFDLVIKHSRLLSVLGAWAYDTLVIMNRHYNRLRYLLGMKYWSFSQYIKMRVKSACTFISRFEETLLHEAERREMDGVICGHIHKAECTLDDKNMHYYNCGDWVENCTALVEDFDGTIHLVTYEEIIKEYEKLNEGREDEIERERLEMEIIPDFSPLPLSEKFEAINN